MSIIDTLKAIEDKIDPGEALENRADAEAAKSALDIMTKERDAAKAALDAAMKELDAVKAWAEGLAAKLGVAAPAPVSPAAVTAPGIAPAPTSATLTSAGQRRVAAAADPQPAAAESAPASSDATSGT